MHLIDFIIKKFVTMHGHINVKFITTSSLHLVLFLSCVEYWQSVTLLGYSSDLLHAFVMNSGCVRVSNEDIVTYFNSLSRQVFARNVDVLLHINQRGM